MRGETLSETANRIFQVVFQNGAEPITVEAAEFSYDTADGADVVNFHRANGSLVSDISVRASEVAHIQPISASTDSDDN